MPLINSVLHIEAEVYNQANIAAQLQIVETSCQSALRKLNELKDDYQNTLSQLDRTITAGEKYRNHINELADEKRRDIERAMEEVHRLREEKMKLYLELIEHEPKAAHHNSLAELHYQQSHFSSAITSSTAAIKLDSKNTTSFYNRGNAYFMQGEFYKALTDYITGSNLLSKNKSIESETTKGHITTCLLANIKAVELGKVNKSDLFSLIKRLSPEQQVSVLTSERVRQRFEQQKGFALFDITSKEIDKQLELSVKKVQASRYFRDAPKSIHV